MKSPEHRKESENKLIRESQGTVLKALIGEAATMRCVADPLMEEAGQKRAKSCPLFASKAIAWNGNPAVAGRMSTGLNTGGPVVDDHDAMWYTLLPGPPSEGSSRREKSFSLPVVDTWPSRKYQGADLNVVFQ